MNIEKMYAFSKEKLIKLIQISQEIGSKSKIDMSDAIFEKIQDVESIDITDILKNKVKEEPENNGAFG